MSVCLLETLENLSILRDFLDEIQLATIYVLLHVYLQQLQHDALKLLAYLLYGVIKQPLSLLHELLHERHHDHRELLAHGSESRQKVERHGGTRRLGPEGLTAEYLVVPCAERSVGIHCGLLGAEPEFPPHVVVGLPHHRGRHIVDLGLGGLVGRLAPTVLPFLPQPFRGAFFRVEHQPRGDLAENASEGLVAAFPVLVELEIRMRQNSQLSSVVQLQGLD